MPTYEYACEECGFELEMFQSIMARPVRKCPECGKLKLQRLIGTGAGVIFKGSGFYETDYRSESYKKAAESETKTADKTDDKPADKKDKTKSKDSKPDSKGKSTSKETKKSA